MSSLAEGARVTTLETYNLDNVATKIKDGRLRGIEPFVVPDDGDTGHRVRVQLGRRQDGSETRRLRPNALQASRRRRGARRHDAHSRRTGKDALRDGGPRVPDRRRAGGRRRDVRLRRRPGKRQPRRDALRREARHRVRRVGPPDPGGPRAVDRRHRPREGGRAPGVRRGGTPQRRDPEPAAARRIDRRRAHRVRVQRPRPGRERPPQPGGGLGPRQPCGGVRGNEAPIRHVDRLPQGSRESDGTRHDVHVRPRGPPRERDAPGSATRTFGYDEVGRPTFVSDGTTTWGGVYDEWGGLTNEALPGGAAVDAGLSTMRGD